MQKVLRIYSPDMLNRNETSILEKLLDTLLPKLMSGEVRIPETIRTTISHNKEKVE